MFIINQILDLMLTFLLGLIRIKKIISNSTNLDVLYLIVSDTDLQAFSTTAYIRFSIQRGGGTGPTKPRQKRANSSKLESLGR